MRISNYLNLVFYNKSLRSELIKIRIDVHQIIHSFLLFKNSKIMYSSRLIQDSVMWILNSNYKYKFIVTSNY